MKHIQVVAGVIRRGDLILATQRGYGPWKDWWEFPGGKIEAGESRPEALQRELSEELDADVAVGDLIRTVEFDYPEFHLTLHCYWCALKSAALHLNEHESARWLTADSLRSVKWLPADEELLPIIGQEIGGGADSGSAPSGRKSRIYVASSWRNAWQPSVVDTLRSVGHEVFDFRHPWKGYEAFRWSDIDEHWQDWTVEQYKKGLEHPIAIEKFGHDLEAMKWADVCVLVLPCGRSAHAEAGWFAGAGKKVIVYIPEPQEPELMYKLFDGVVSSLDELLTCLEEINS